MQAQQPSVTPGAADEMPGLGEYVGILRKRRGLLFKIGLPIVALGAFLALALPDVYRSSGLIEIEGAESARPSSANSDSLKDTIARASEEPRYADQYVQSLSMQVLNDSNLRQLLRKYRLYDDQDADEKDAIKEVRGDIHVDIVTVPILDPENGREREVVTAFTVSYENRDPRRALQGARWLVDSFIEANRLDRQRYAAGSAKFFGAEAERMGRHVSQLEAKLAEFKAKNVGQLPELNEMNMNVMDRTENEIQSVESQMQALRRERVFLVAQLAQARATGPETSSLHALEDEYKRKAAMYDESHPDMVAMRRQIDMLRAGGSPTGMSLRAQLQQQRSILAEARQRYSEDHPDIKRIMRNIQSLEARIAAGETADRAVAEDSPMAVQLQTQVNATDTQIAALQGRVLELRTKMNDLETRMSAAPQVEREYQNVTRDLAGARAKFDELRKRQMDAEVNEAAIAGGTADKFTVKSNPGLADKPAKPQRLAIFAVAFVLACLIGITSIVLSQFLDQTVRGVRDVRDILDVTPLSAVPVIERPKGSARRGSGFGFARAAILLIVIGVAVSVVVAQFVH